MKRIVRLTESDLTRIVRRVISEQEQTVEKDWNAVYMGTVYLVDPKTRKEVGEGFYTYKTSTQPDGSKVVLGKTFRDGYAKDFVLRGHCKDGKTEMYMGGSNKPVTVSSPAWKPFCTK
jgi:hypothetical protein